MGGGIPAKSASRGSLSTGAGAPVLYLADPPGVSRDLRRATLDRIAAINASRAAIIGDPDIASYEPV